MLALFPNQSQGKYIFFIIPAIVYVIQKYVMTGIFRIRIVTVNKILLTAFFLSGIVNLYHPLINVVSN